MKNIYLYLVLFLPLLGAAQTTITLKSAIDTTLRHSFELQIAGNNLEVSKINNTLGVAGGLPSVNASVNDNQSVSNVNQKLNTGTQINKSSATGNTMNSSIAAGMLLFNGFKLMATKGRLEHLQALSQLQLNIAIQNRIAMVMIKYYDIIRQQEYLKIIQSSLDVAQQKLDIVTARKNVGMANDADYFQALIDVNTSNQSLKSQQLQVDQAKTDLLEIMSQKQYYPISVTDSIVVDRSIELNTVTNYLRQNPQYLAAEQQISINEQIVKEVSALRYPSLRLNAGFNLNRTQSSAGLQLLNQNYGPYAGLNLQIPLYNGNNYKIQKETALLNVNNAVLGQETILNALTSDAVRLYQSYNSTLVQLDSQRKSVETSEKLIKLVLLRFQVSQATILDVKAAQASHETTGYQLVNLNYEAKIAEIELKRLMYQLGN